MTPQPERTIGRDLTSALNDSTGSYELVFAVMAAAGFGFLVDRAFGTVPVVTIIFAVIGSIGGGYKLWLDYQARMDSAIAARNERRGA